MNLQYILDSKGRTTGVFIPINEWNDLKSKYKDIEEKNITILEWHKDFAKERLEDYKNNPDSAINFDSALNDIEKEL